MHNTICFPGPLIDFQGDTLLPLVESIFTKLPSLLQRFAVHLTVFRGSWSVEAAVFVLDAPDAAALCSQLHAQNVVLKEEASARFSMEPSVRTYLLSLSEHIAQLDIDLLKTRHFAWFESLVQTYAPKLERTSDAEALQRLESEKDNLLAAARFAKGEAKVNFALGLWRWTLLRGHYSEGLEVLGCAYTLVLNAPREAKAKIHRGMGLIDNEKGNYPQAIQHLKTAFKLADGGSDLALVAQILMDLAYVESLNSLCAEASRHYEEAMGAWQYLRDNRGIASALNGKGILAWKEGKLEEACVLLSKSAETFLALEDKHQAMRVYSNIGMLHAKRKDFRQAEKVHKMCLEHFRSANIPSMVAASLSNLGDVLIGQRQISEALNYLLESLKIMQQAGNQGFIHIVVANMAFALSEPSSCRNDNSALMLFGASEGLRQRLGEAIDEDVRLAIDVRLKRIREKTSPAVYGRLTKMGAAMSVDAIINKFDNSQTIAIKGV